MTDTELAEKLKGLARRAPQGSWRLGLWAGAQTQKHVVDMGEPPKAPFMLMNEAGSHFGASGVIHSDGPRDQVEAAAELIVAFWRHRDQIIAALDRRESGLAKLREAMADGRKIGFTEGIEMAAKVAHEYARAHAEKEDWADAVAVEIEGDIRKLADKQ